MKRPGLFFLFVVIVVSACEDASVPQVQTQQITDLETVEAQLQTVAREIQFDGVIEAINRATVSAQTSGRVTELPYDVGDYVEKGSVIARLTDSEQRAGLDAAEANLKLAGVQLEDAEKQFKRVSDIFSKGLVSQAELDNANTRYRSAQANFDAAKSAVTQAREGLQYTEIIAPYSGIVLSRAIEPGELVAPGRELMAGLSLEHLRVIVDIPQQYIGPLRKHKSARVLFEDGRTLNGDQVRIPPAADATSHTFRVLVNLPEGEHGVFPGTLVKVAFASGEQAQLLVPKETVVHRGELTAVYVVSENSGIEFRYVRTGYTSEPGMTAILSGLDAAERVAQDPVVAAKTYRQQL